MRKAHALGTDVHRDLDHFLRQRTLLEAGDEFVPGPAAGPWPVETIDDFDAQLELDVPGIGAASARLFNRSISAFVRNDSRSKQRHIRSSDTDISLPNIWSAGR